MSDVSDNTSTETSNRTALSCFPTNVLLDEIILNEILKSYYLLIDYRYQNSCIL